MSRRDTDAIVIPIDITKVTPVVRPWTKEEADAAREEYKRSLRLRNASPEGAGKDRENKPDLVN